MKPSRIPRLSDVTPAAARSWLRRMHAAGLLFCLDDDPRDIVSTANGQPLFTAEECVTVSELLNQLFVALGDAVHDLAFDVVSQTFHTHQERAMHRSLYG